MYYVRREKDERRYRRAFVVSVTVQALIKVSQSIARPERDESNQQSPTQSVIVEAKLRLADGYGSVHRNRTILQSRDRPKHISPFNTAKLFPSSNADSFMFLYFPNLPLDSSEIRFTLASNLNLVFFRRRRRRRCSCSRGPVDTEYATSSV